MSTSFWLRGGHGPFDIALAPSGLRTNLAFWIKGTSLIGPKISTKATAGISPGGTLRSRVETQSRGLKMAIWKRLTDTNQRKSICTI
jgi:hypothetical protein